MASYSDYSPYNDRSGSSTQPSDMSEFVMGNIVVVSIQVRHAETNQFVDPDTITLSVRKPGTSVMDVYTQDHISRDAVGKYHLDVRLTAPGIWAYRWDTSAPAEGSITGRFVARSNLI